MYICINTRKVKLTKKISIKELDTILIAYSALVFKDFETSRKVFDKHCDECWWCEERLWAFGKHS